MKKKFLSWFQRAKMPFWFFDTDRLFIQREVENICYKAYLKGRKDVQDEYNDPS